MVQGRWDRAKAEFDKAVRARPFSAPLRAARGRFCLARSQFGNAAEDFARAEELAPDDVEIRFERALSLLLLGDMAGYRTARAAMPDRFRARENVDVGNRAAADFVYVPEAVADMPGLIRVAERSVPEFAGGSRIVGAALYHAGRYTEALSRFKQSQEVFQPRAWDWLFMAMIHCRLGHAEEAGRMLEKADLWITEADRSPRHRKGTEPCWTDASEAMAVRLLRREAEALIRFDPIFPDDPFARRP
jgi:tetratricopeptide (TPR) repeat protein